LIRGLLCLAVIIIAMVLVSPASSSSSDAYSPGIQTVTPLATADPLNVTGASTAFNYTLSSANIFSNSTAVATPAVTGNPQFKWFSTINNTKNSQPIPGTAFNFTANPTLSPSRQEVNWTLPIPRSNCSTCHTYVSFTLFGNLTKGTSENFTLTNSTIPIISGIFHGNETTQLPLCTLASPTNATVCGPTVKLLVDKYVKSTLQLSFRFGWNATGEILKASVGEVVVESLDNTIKNSNTNFITQTAGNHITHSATLFPVTYNTTNSVAPWTNEVLNVYYPSGYNLTQLQLNQTNASPITIFSSSSSPPAPFERTTCKDGSLCTQSLIAINMSDTQPLQIHNSTIYITSLTKNSITQLSTLSGGVATGFFTSGDQIGVKVVNAPSIVNASESLQTGTLNITFTSGLSIQPSIVSTAKGGIYNFTLPPNCGTSGRLCAKDWNVYATFKSLYDIGNATLSFRIDLLQVTSFSATGGNNALSVHGTIQYGNGNAASGINATLFAIDQGTPVNRPVTNNQTKVSSSQLYISNVTLVNGVFTQGQSLIMLFTIVNPNATQAFNATVTIEHDWPGPQRHNMTVPVFLGLGDGLGDFAFTNATARTYKATITFTGTGVQVVVTSLFTGNPTNSLVIPQGTSPVVPNRQHAGLFNITITSMINNTREPSPSSIQSPTYAYVAPSLVPSRYLYGSPVFPTNPDGSFAETINSDSLLGAENLTVFVLARNAFGIVVVNNLPSSGFTDSTTLISSADAIGAVAKGQPATATLHLKSNSTKITEIITVNLVLQGNGMTPQTKATQTGVTISPGSSQTVQLSFTAPSNIGLYTLTFFSPEYGGPLASQTVQVVILQSNLQILIPAAIGVVAAIIVLSVYLIRGRPAEEVEEETKSKPTSPKTKPFPTNPPSKSLTRPRGRGG
jgi:hypothetical protein